MRPLGHGDGRSARTRRGRRGASLVLFVVLIFALMAVASLTIDVGTTNLTQSLMQDAVDTASLDGHRWREYHRFQFPYERRFEVGPLVGQVFDDDFDPSNGDALNFGAGPVFETRSAATGGLAVGAQPVYDPTLRFNRPNYPYGDMVSGEYDPDRPHDEQSDYQRADFACTPDVDDGHSGAFLVRMRRTGLHNELDDVGSKSSKGPGMPLLFGRGTMIHGTDPQRYDPRNQGLTVRATAIALSMPALSVGVLPDVGGSRIPYKPRPNDPLQPLAPGVDFYPGVAPIALLDTFWTSWEPTSPNVHPPTGESAYVVPDEAGQPIGRLRNATGEIVGFFVEDLLQVGREVVHRPRPAEIAEHRAFVPVYRVVDGVKRVVGFGWAEIELVESEDGSEPDELRMVKHYSSLPVGGTSCSLVWPVDPLTAPVWDEILQANRELFSNDGFTSAALAPAIAR